MQGDIIDFEFVHNGVYPPECDEGCDSCGSECDEEEDEDEVTGLSFDMDLMDLFTKESGISISSEDFMCYLVSMEFISLCLSLFLHLDWEDCWEISSRLAQVIEEIRHPDPNTYTIAA